MKHWNCWMRSTQSIQREFRPLHFLTFCYLQPYAKIVGVKAFFPSSSYILFPVMTKWKQDRRKFCKFMKMKRCKYLIDIKYSDVNSVLSWNTFGSDCSLEYSLVRCDKLPCKSSQAVRLNRDLGGQPFSGLSRDAHLGPSPGSGWATQGHCCP